MIKYEQDLSARVNGNNLQPLQGAEVRVTDKATGLPAALYQDDELTPIPQPLITTNTGYFGFKAADGKYTLTFSATQNSPRFDTFTREIVLEDPADNPFATLQELALPNGATKIGYGSGRTVSDKLGETVSVFDKMTSEQRNNTYLRIGTVVVTDAIQAAQAALNGKPGTVLFPAGKYKVDGKVVALAGQNFIGQGAEIEVSEYDGVFLSYNEADTFSLTDPALGAFHPPTLIEGFKVMGKVSIPAPNRNFVFAKINRTPHVTMRDCTLYYAAAAHVFDESILCAFENVRCYNPVSDSFWFNCTDAVGRFSPNACTLNNCWIEEQKFPCNGVRISAGNINISNTYMESLSAMVLLDGEANVGRSVNLINPALGIRTQSNSVGIQVDQPSTVQVSGGGMTFGGLGAGTSTGFVFNAKTTLTIDGLLVVAQHGNAEASTLFSSNADFIGSVNITVLSKVFGGASTVFDFGNNPEHTYRGKLSGHFEAEAGCGLAFVANNANAGKLAASIGGSRFVRVSSLVRLSTSNLDTCTFDGAGSAIVMNGGTARNNTFQSSGWSITGAALNDGNFGLYGTGMQPKPMTSAYLTTLTAIPHDTYTKVVFDAEEYDTNDAYAIGTGRFQPNVPGYYSISAQLAWYPSTVGVVQAYIYKNGASYKAGPNNPDNTNGNAMRAEADVYLNGTTDYVEIFARQTSGANLNIANGADNTFMQAKFERSA